MPVEIVGGLKREKRSHPHYKRSQHLVMNVEVIMGEATPLPFDDAVIWILGGILRDGATESLALLHALEYEVHAVAFVTLHVTEPRLDVIILAHALCSPLDRDLLVASIRFNPSLVVLSPLGQSFLRNGLNTKNAPEEIRQLFRTCQIPDVAVDDNPVEAVVHKDDHPPKQSLEKVHRVPPRKDCLLRRLSCIDLAASKFQIFLARFNSLWSALRSEFPLSE